MLAITSMLEALRVVASELYVADDLAVELQTAFHVRLSLASIAAAGIAASVSAFACSAGGFFLGRPRPRFAGAG